MQCVQLHRYCVSKRQLLHAPVTNVMFGCSDTKLYNPEVRVDGPTAGQRSIGDA